MDLNTLLSYNWEAMTPELVVLATALLLSLIDLFTSGHRSRRWMSWLAFTGVLLAIVFLIGQLGDPVTTILGQTYRLDSFSKAFKLILLAGTAFVFLMAFDYDRKAEIKHRGEFYYLLLTALLGGMIVTSSADMITLFVGLELLSLSSYIMVGLRKKDQASNEAAFKYFVNGGIATAIFLFGLSYIYGLSGSTNIYEISTMLGASNPLIVDHRFLVVFTSIIIFAGLSFKIATVPFHMWTPDVYEGAPTPVTAFLSVVSKTVGFVLLLRLLLIVFMQAPGAETSQTETVHIFTTVYPYLMVLAGLAMIIGNTAALKQTNVKRLFAYSSIAHAGYVLVSFVSLTFLTFDNIWFYLIAFLLMNLGAFAIIQVVTEKAGSEDLSIFSGLYRRSPFLALAMALFLVSLAGIPVTAGFIAKFNVLTEAILMKRYVIASVMMGGTVISYFYYFGIIARMFFQSPGQHDKPRLSFGTSIVVFICVVGTLMLGIYPDAALSFLHENFNFKEFFQANL